MRPSFLAVFLAVGFAACDVVVGADFDVRPRGSGAASGGTGGEAGAGGAMSAGGDPSGTGGETICDPLACPASDTDCATVVCLSNECGYEYVARGSACDDGGTYCDGGGACVECTENDHCLQNEACFGDSCYDVSCYNNMLDTGETDIDCGGPLCAPCAHGKKCDVGSDCLSTLCIDTTCEPCTASSQCFSSEYCNAMGECRPKQLFGALCSDDEECQSGCCAPFGGMFSICSASTDCA